MHNKIRKYSVNIVYSLIWVVPFLIFAFDHVSLKSFVNILNYDTWKIFLFTFYQAFLSSILALCLAFIPSLYVSKNNNIITSLLKASVLIPLFFPAVSTVMVFSIIGNTELMKNLGFLYSLKAIVVANIFYNMPLFVKFIGDALSKIPGSVIEYSKTEGCSSLRIFFSVKLPLIYPALLKAFFLCTTFCFINLAIIIGLGGINFSTLEVLIATTLSSSMSFSAAFGYGLIQFLFITLLNIGTSSVEIYELEESSSCIEKTSFIETIFSISYLLFEYLLVSCGVIFAFYNFYNGQFEFAHIIRIFSSDFNQYYPVVNSLFNSTMISFSTAIITTLLSFVLLKNLCFFTSWIILSSCGISSAFLGIVLLYLNIKFDIHYFVLVVMGYVLIATPFTSAFLFQPVLSFQKELIEAGKVDGCSPLKVFRYIEFPILLPFFISSFMLVFAISFGEFTIAYTMQLINYLPTVSVVNYFMLSSRYFMESSALNGLNIIIVLTVFVCGEVISSKYARR